MSIQDFLTISSAVAAGGFIVSGLHEWRAARRIVPVAGLNAAMVAKHGCVPTQFAGSRHKRIRVLLAVYGFLLVTPRIRKQAFLCREVVGVREGLPSELQAIKPGHLLRVTLDEIERPASFVRSMRRDSSGGYRTIAVRDLDEARSLQRAFCVTVRAQGEYCPTVEEPRRPTWLQFHVVGVAPRSRFETGAASLADLPEDAMHLILAGDASPGRTVVWPGSPWRRALRSLLVRRNKSAWVGLVHTLTRYAAVYLLLYILPRVVGAISVQWTAANQVISVASLAISLAIVLALPGSAVLIWVRVTRGLALERLPSTDLSKSAASGSEDDLLPTHLVKTPAPLDWTGATSRCQNAGRICNGTNTAATLGHLWRRVAYRYRPLRDRYRRVAHLGRSRHGQRNDEKAQTDPPESR